MKKSEFKLFIVCVIAVFCSTWLLFYLQAVQPDGGWASDLPAHLNTTHNRELGYSLNSLLFKIAYHLIPSYVFVTCIMSMIVVLTICVVYSWIRNKTQAMGNRLVVFVAVTSVFLTSIYIPKLYPFFYQKSYVTQPWHNSTYLTMRLTGMLVFIFYLNLEQRYLKKYTWKDWILFTLLLSVSNYAKPNFLFGFAPMMLCFLIYDFFKTRGRTVMRQISMGMSVMVSMLVLFFQSKIVYSPETESGVAFTFERLNELYTFPPIGLKLIMGLPFAIFVLCVLWTNKLKVPKLLKQGWIFAFFCWFFRTFFKETGPREAAGNFGWQIYMGAFVLTIISFIVFYNQKREKKISEKTFCTGMVFYFLQTGLGIVYFATLLTDIRGSYMF